MTSQTAAQAAVPVEDRGKSVFVQVIQAKTSDPPALKDATDRWADELAQDAEGWLGTTAGVTADGTFLAVVRFESEEAARRNSRRPEQDQWWAETSTHLDGPAAFLDSEVVVEVNVGDTDRAGFVQIMQGHGTDPDRARELMTQDSGLWAEFRPDVLGSIATQYEDGTYTMTMYFTSEAEARVGEKKEPPPRLQAQMEEMATLADSQPEFFDITDPWIYTPR
jgi:hypothetical protein